MGTIILSALVAHTGWHWMMERWDRLRQFRFQWPDFDPAIVAAAMRWTIVILILGGVAGLVVWLVRQRDARSTQRDAGS